MTYTLVGRLDALMAARGLNPYSTARMAGVGDSYVRDIQRGKVKDPSAVKLLQVAKVLHCTVEYLLTGEGDTPQPALAPLGAGRWAPDRKVPKYVTEEQVRAIFAEEAQRRA